MRNSLTRALTGAAIVAVAVGAAAGTASASSKPAAKTATTLSIATSAATITGGSKETITGTLKAGTASVANGFVYLDRVSGKKLVPVAAKRTGAHGVAAFTFIPFATATYELVFHGNAKYAASASGTATVTVDKTATALSITPSATSISGGSKETITGTLTAGTTDLGGQRVVLTKVVGKKLVPFRAAATNKTTGVVSFTFVPFSTASYELVYAGTPKYDPADSASATVTVNKTATTLTAAASKATITKGDRDTITGTLKAGSTPVKGQWVFLYIVGSNKKLHLIAAAKTGSAGTVTFKVAPRATTKYELAFPATLKLAGSVSGTVTITVAS